ncbi:hypothetical protein MMC15_008497 [Xylographa vitiligo]|nr:hypothetical protein [Xylographa vitiligo]
MAAIANFVKDSDLYKTVKPYIYYGPELSIPSSNLALQESSLSLTDLRTVSDFKPTIESHGFCFIENKSKELPTITDESTSQPYAIEMTQVLKKLLGATIVIPVQTRLRSSNKEPNKGSPGTEAHIDTTVFDAWGRMHMLMTQEEQELVLSGKYRARIINFWRPMINHAEDFPLAVLDPTSIDYDNDAVALDFVTPTSAAETAYLKHNPNHQWYWLSNQTPDEAIVFTQYDTHPPKGMFNHVGHCAFRNGAARPGCPPRRSIEARFIALEPAPYEKPTTLANPHPPETQKQPWREFIDLPEAHISYKSTFVREDLQIY